MYFHPFAVEPGAVIASAAKQSLPFLLRLLPASFPAVRNDGSRFDSKRMKVHFINS